MEANRLGRKKTLVLVLVATFVMVLSAALSVVAGAAMLPSHAAPSTNAASSAPAAAAAPASVPAATSVPGALPTSPHPGVIDVYHDGGPMTTVDPAIAYYTLDYEPIANVYQTLVAYNGTTTGNFVPVAATCVPGTPQCTKDYGTSMPGFTGIFNQTGATFTGTNGEPIYWTFVIDPAAHFYDPGNSTGWPVYPSDLVFSMARTMAAMELPSEYTNPGWIQTQALLPIGNPHFDGGIHFPYNNTPYDVLSSMLVNNSSYCPATAMNGIMGNGCVTYIANGTGEDWPEFLEFMVDNLGASIEPCGWFTAVGAGVPGFTGSLAPHGDGGCLLPGGAKSTSDASFQTYLASVAPGTSGQYSWDAFENLSTGAENFQPVVKTTMVGSGPYWGSVDLASGYGLEASPAYMQPSGCGGNPTDFAQYTGYCSPAPGSFAGTVHVEENTGDSVGLADYEAGTADFADIQANHVAEMLALQADGKINIVSTSSINVFQSNYAFFYNTSTRAADGWSGATNIPENFFSYESARQLFNMAYPTATIESQVWTTDGLQALIPLGSWVPPGLGCYAPHSLTGGCDNTYTVPFQDTTNGGNVNTNPNTVGSAAWWWAQGRNASSPYYDPELAACTPGSPCEIPIEGITGDPPQDAANALWASSVESITSNAIVINTPDVAPATELTDCDESLTGTSPCAISTGYGWIADYPDPTDFAAAYATADADYAYTEGTAGVLGAADVFNNTTACAALYSGNAHSGPSFKNLTFWANETNTTAIPNVCQGTAWSLGLYAITQAAPLPAGTSLSSQRVLLYDLEQTIYNALALATWSGQQHVYATAATWIDPSSINENPTIGAGDVQLWSMIKYATAVTTVATTFTETGLGKGTPWSVVVGGQSYASVSTKAVVSLPTGTYTYTVAVGDAYAPAVGSSGGTLIVGTKPATVALKFVDVGADVVFSESGLKKGMVWGVTIGPNVLVGTNLSKVSVRMDNGTYAFSVTAPAGYVVSGLTNLAGHVTVAGPKTSTVKLKFEPYNGFGATFTPDVAFSGAWAVALKLQKGTGPLAAKPGSLKSATNAPISWSDLANGTYTYTATAKGFTTVTGTIVINNASVSTTINFVAKALPSTAAPLVSLALPANFMAPTAQRSRAL